MRFLQSIRWRLQLWYGLLLVAVLSGFGITAYQLESARLVRRIDEGLQQRVPPLVASQHPAWNDRTRRELTVSPRVAALFDRVEDGNFYYVVWLRHGEPVTYSASAPRDIPAPRPGDPPNRTRGALRETFLFPGPGDCVLVGRSIAGDLAGLRQLAWWLAGVGVAVVILGLAVGAWLVVRALHPLRDISAAARKIATGDLKQRIDTATSGGELGQLAEVLNSTFARLDAAFAQQARFTADAAHELRTPVTVMLAHAQEGLAGPCSNPDHQCAFEASQRAAQRMRRLIESLLQLARLDAGQETIQPETCDLATLAADGMEMLQPLAELRSVRFVPSLGPAPCRGDPDRLMQVVTNLLSNAIEYNEPRGLVRIGTGRDDRGAFLAVANTGPGIPPEDLPLIFERFHRADAARASAGGHSGLGLAITRAIVQAHGGEIVAKSEPAGETTLVVRLPG